jgi:hypothetical protein
MMMRRFQLAKDHIDENGDDENSAYLDQEFQSDNDLAKEEEAVAATNQS